MSERPFAVIFGATSLVGRHLVARLAARGFEGLCLSRQAGPSPYQLPRGFSWDTLSNGETLDVPVATILFSLVPVSALPALLPRVTGAGRLIALSTSRIRFKAQSTDPEEREQVQLLVQAENTVRSCCRDRGIVWTIFRPTLIYDPGRDRNVSEIAAFVQRFGVFPMIRPGRGERQPIHADDVAQALVAAAGSPRARHARFDLPGGETLTYREMVGRIFEALGRRPLILYLPLGVARSALYVWQRLVGKHYSNVALERMNTSLTLDPAPVQEALGITCRPFRPEFRKPANS